MIGKGTIYFGKWKYNPDYWKWWWRKSKVLVDWIEYSSSDWRPSSKISEVLPSLNSEMLLPRLLKYLWPHGFPKSFSKPVSSSFGEHLNRFPKANIFETNSLGHFDNENILKIKKHFPLFQFQKWMSQLSYQSQNCQYQHFHGQLPTLPEEIDDAHWTVNRQDLA